MTKKQTHKVRYVHPHDERVIVMDTMDRKGNWIDTRNEWNLAIRAGTRD